VNGHCCIYLRAFSPIEENKYVQLIAECPSKEWRERLTERFENWKNQKDE